jgi:hypothetical protein
LLLRASKPRQSLYRFDTVTQNESAKASREQEFCHDEFEFEAKFEFFGSEWHDAGRHDAGGLVTGFCQ